MTRVLLGAEMFLHAGLHGALEDQPPTGVQYERCKAHHTLFLPRVSGTLFSDLPLGEFVDFGPGSEFVHSVYWPVLDRRAWAAATADFSYVLFGGHYCLSQEFREREANRATRSAWFEQCLRVRLRTLFRAFAHGSCKALLLLNGHEMRNTRRILRERANPSERDVIEPKLTLVYPAAAPCPVELVERKWSDCSPLRVVFCGRWFDAKKGRLALNVFRRLAGDSRVSVTYIGPIPAEVQAGTRDLLAAITHYPHLDRAEVLTVLASAHILFHPSESESLGAVILEAIASGSAVICATGRGMAHIADWFEAGGAELIDRSDGASEAQEEAAFDRALRHLIEHPDRCRSHGWHNYRAACEGPLSLKVRDETLGRVYSAQPAASALRVEDCLPREAERVWTMASRELVGRREQYLRSLGLHERSVDVAIDL